MLKKSINLELNKYIQYLFMFFVIIYGQTVWIRMNYNHRIYSYLYIVLSIAMIVLICLQGSINGRSFLMALILMAILFIFYFFSGYGLSLVLRVSVLLGLLVIYLWSLYDTTQILNFVKKYSDIIFIIAIISIVLYILGPTLNIFEGHVVHYFWAGRNKSCTTYFNLLYVTQTENFFGRSFVRNSAIFCEAPSFAVPLLISLFIELFAKPSINRPRVAIFLIAIITSFSTKAFLVVGVMISLKLLYLLVFDPRTNNNMIILRALIPIMIIIVLFAMIIVLNQKSDSGSYISRMDNISSTLKAFRDHLFIGVGLGNEEAISKYSNLDLVWQGFSIGATLLLAEGGIYIALFYLSSFIKGIVFSKDKWLVFCTFVVYFSILFMSNIPYFPSTIVVLALGFSVHKKPDLENVSEKI